MSRRARWGSTVPAASVPATVTVCFSGTETVSLARASVGVCGVEVVNFASGMAYINVDDKGNNNIIVHPGANHKLGFEMIEVKDPLF